MDIEATGLLEDPKARPVEIGAVRHNLHTGEILNTFESFCRPANDLLDDAKFALCKRISGIEREQILDAPCFKQVVRDFIHWVGDTRLYTWNMAYDQRMLHRYLRDWQPSADLPIPRTDPVDTLGVLHKLGGFHWSEQLSWGGCWRQLYTWMHPDRAGCTVSGQLKTISLSRAMLYEGMAQKQIHRALSDADYAARIGQVIYRKLQD
jgi:inhibitor of KinA sporulation pathway (predicted exonuclease)